eukprot:6542843-Heterocapsa_arctica.AAC.1
MFPLVALLNRTHHEPSSATRRPSFDNNVETPHRHYRRAVRPLRFTRRGEWFSPRPRPLGRSRAGTCPVARPDASFRDE